MHKGYRAWLSIIIVMIIIASVALWLALRPANTGSVLALGDNDFVEMIRSWGNWGIAGSVSLMVLHSFIPYPAEALAMANGAVYGPILGSIVTWLGAMLGSLVAFGCTRLLGHRMAKRFLPARQWSELETWSTRHGWQTLLVVRLIPLISFNLVNYAAGLTPVKLWTFIWTTGLGIVPVVVASVWLGDRAGALPTWSWPALALVTLICVLLFPRIYRKNKVAAGKPKD